MSNEAAVLSRLKIRNTVPRWAGIVRQMIRRNKGTRRKEKPMVKDEPDAVPLDSEHAETKALKESEEVEQEIKQKVSSSILN